jgi:hypothetical protein
MTGFSRLRKTLTCAVCAFAALLLAQCGSDIHGSAGGGGGERGSAEHIRIGFPF